MIVSAFPARRRFDVRVGDDGRSPGLHAGRQRAARSERVDEDDQPRPVAEEDFEPDLVDAAREPRRSPRPGATAVGPAASTPA